MRFNLKATILKILFGIFFSSGLLSADVELFKAEASTLIPCKISQALDKRLLNSTKKIENRLQFYAAESKEAKALESKILLTKLRYTKYKENNLLCGSVDGLPHLIITGDFHHSNEFLLPGIAFLYIAGWIGWTGRKYLQQNLTASNIFEAEIFINVPIMLKIACTGFLWPVHAVQEFANGSLLSPENDITKSPR